MSEDPEREPDGVPHDIVGRTVLAATAVSFVGVAALAGFGLAGGAIVVLVAIPILVVSLSGRSERERDHEPNEREHPSR